MKYNVGAAIKEPGNSLETKKAGWRVQKPEVNHEKCTKCGICWMFCPDAAIFKDRKGAYQWDYDYCKGCGICAQVCPVKCIQMVEEDK
jgi:pyruvate ferredoxin oxidoreductase delta subunit